VFAARLSFKRPRYNARCIILTCARSRLDAATHSAPSRRSLYPYPSRLSHPLLPRERACRETARRGEIELQTRVAERAIRRPREALLYCSRQRQSCRPRARAPSLLYSPVQARFPGALTVANERHAVVCAAYGECVFAVPRRRRGAEAEARRVR